MQTANLNVNIRYGKGPDNERIVRFLPVVSGLVLQCHRTTIVLIVACQVSKEVDEHNKPGFVNFKNII